MEELYRVSIDFEYDEIKTYKKGFFGKTKQSTIHCTSNINSSIIFAENKEDAIEKFKEFDSTKEYVQFLKSRNYTNLDIKYSAYRFQVELYNLNRLQQILKAKDFLRFCKNELGLEQTINNIING